MRPGVVKAVRVRIAGRVQGVWFRAEARSLDGWVRNRRDGTVEAVFAGPEAAVEAMLAECRDGPPQARVDSVETKPAAAPEDAGFRTRVTE